MGIPCRKCGSQRTNSIHGWRDLLARAFGYRAKRCLGCYRVRWIRKSLTQTERAGGPSDPPERSSLREQASTNAVAPSMGVTLPPRKIIDSGDESKHGHSPAMEAAVPAREMKPPAAVPVATPPAASEFRGALCCPFCGASRVQRSRRRSFERLIGKGKMMRCRMCGKRFPLERAELREVLG